MAAEILSSYEELVLEFDPFEGDFGEPGDRILSDKMVTARKQRKCSHCEQEIQVGERVRSMTAKFGDLMSYSWCAGCCGAMAAYTEWLDGDCEGNDSTALAFEERLKLRNATKESTQ